MSYADRAADAGLYQALIDPSQASAQSKINLLQQTVASIDNDKTDMALSGPIEDTLTFVTTQNKNNPQTRAFVGTGYKTFYIISGEWSYCVDRTLTAKGVISIVNGRTYYEIDDVEVTTNPSDHGCV